MKKLLITAVIISMAIPAFSQGKEYATKDVWELGGSAGYSSQTLDIDVTPAIEVKETTLSFAPEAGYFVADNISLGLMLDYTNRTEEETGTPDEETTTTELFFAPTYIFKQDKMYWYIGALLGMYSMKNGIEVSETNYGVRGGAKVKVGDNGLLNFGLQYLMGSGDSKMGANPKVDFDSNELRFRAGFSLYL